MQFVVAGLEDHVFLRKAAGVNCVAHRLDLIISLVRRVDKLLGTHPDHKIASVSIQLKSDSMRRVVRGLFQVLEESFGGYSLRTSSLCGVPP